MKTLLAAIAFFTFSSFCFIQPSTFYLGKQPKGHYVDLRGKKQFVVVEGTGKPTVVFVAAKGVALDDYMPVYTKIEKSVQIFAYDRAGLGRSESLNNERTVDTMAYELHELLVKEKIEPPYILVGHSMGGFVIRCFANMYPNQVTGLVFIDAACEFEFKKFMEIRNDADKIKFRRGFDSLINVPSRPKGINDESKHLFDYDKDNFSSNSNIVKGLKIPNNIPVTVFVSTQLETGNPYSKSEKEIRLAYFKSWKNEAPQIKLIETSKSGHCIQCNEPDLIIDGIQEMLKELKGK